MHADSPAAPPEGAGTGRVARAQEGPSSAAASMPAMPSEQQQGPSQDVINSSPISSLPIPTDPSSRNPTAAGRSVGRGGEAPLPPGFTKYWHSNWQQPRATYDLHCPAHGVQKIKDYQQLEDRIKEHAACRQEWAELLQQKGESKPTYRGRLLGLGLHFRRSLVPYYEDLQCQAAAAECRAQRPLQTGPPIASAGAAAAGVAAAALPDQLALDQGGSLTRPATAISDSLLPELLKDFQRTTEQLVKDKLQEQRAFLEEQTLQKMELLQRDNERLRQEAEGVRQQALPPQQQSLASCRASAEEQRRRVEELKNGMARLRQENERLKEEARLQQEQYAQERAAAEEQRRKMEAFGERLGQIAERLCAGVKAQQQKSAAQCQTSAEQQGREGEALGRGPEQLRQEAEQLRCAVEQLQQHCPAQGQAVTRDKHRKEETLQEGGNTRLRQGVSGEAELLGERAMAPQQQEPAAARQASTDARTARLQGLERDVMRVREMARLQRQERPAVGRSSAPEQHQLDLDMVEREEQRLRQDLASWTQARAKRQREAAPSAATAAPGRSHEAEPELECTGDPQDESVSSKAERSGECAALQQQQQQSAAMAQAPAERRGARISDLLAQRPAERRRARLQSMDGAIQRLREGARMQQQEHPAEGRSAIEEEDHLGCDALERDSKRQRQDSAHDAGCARPEQQQRRTAQGRVAAAVQDRATEEPLHSQQQCQVPIRMDQVLLQWDGGNTVVLARIQDVEGSWVCYKELHIKLGASMSMPAQQAQHRREVPGYKPATHEELGFLRATGALNSHATRAVLITVDKAVRICAMAEVAAPVLAAMSGIAELQPYSAPLPRAHLLMAPQSGASAPAQCTNSQSGKSLLAQPHQAKPGESGRESACAAAASTPAGRQPQAVPQLFGPKLPARISGSAKDGAPACKAAAEPHRRQQCLERPVADGNAARLGKATISAVEDRLKGVQQRVAQPLHLGKSAAGAAAAAILTNQERVLWQLASPDGAAEAPPVRETQQAHGGVKANSGLATSSASGEPQSQWQAALVGSNTKASFGSAAADDSAAAERLQRQRQVPGAKRPAQKGLSAMAATMPTQEQVPSFPCSAAGEQLLARCLKRMQWAQRAARLAQDSQPARSGVAVDTAGTKRKRKLEAMPCRALGMAGLDSATPDQAAAAGQQQHKRLCYALVQARAAAASLSRIDPVWLQVLRD